MRHFKVISLDARKSVFRNKERHSPGPRISGVNTKPTARELEVEDLLCRGYSQENIAAIFGRSINTVSAHVQSLYRKRGVHTQVGLLLAYLERKNIFVFCDEPVAARSKPFIAAGAAQ